MALLIMLGLLAVTAAKTVILQSCSKGECGNFTIFLGERFVSKVIGYPNYPKLRGPSEEEAQKLSDTIKDGGTRESVTFELGSNNFIDTLVQDNSSEKIYPLPQHRPIPEDTEMEIDYTNQDYVLRTTQRPFYNKVNSIMTPGWVNDAETVDLKVPFEFGTVDLSGNDITGEDVKTFFDSLSVLSNNVTKQLRRLFLSSNKIQYLPLAVFPVDLEYGLEELRLDHNRLNFLSSQTRFELSRLGNLRVLNLSTTNLRFFGSLHIPSLEVLDLSGNQLFAIPPSLESLPNIQLLDLSSNYIVTVSSSPISSLENLRVLSLENNGLKEIWGDPFGKLYRLQDLHLNNNSLKTMSSVENLGSVTTLYLRNNPWECSCPLLTTAHGPIPMIADREELTCVDDEHDYPRRVSYLIYRDVRIGCAWKWNWIKEHSVDITRWFSHHGLYISRILWWVMLVVVVVVILRILRLYRKKIPKDKDNVPYNPLDDKMITV